MPETKKKTASIHNLEVPGVVREIAEKSVQQARETYDKVKTAAEDATDIIEDTYTSTAKGMTEYSLKSLEMTRTNINANFDFMREFLSVKTLSEAVELQTSFARKQMESLSTQAKELSNVASQIAQDAGSPVKEGMQKAFKNVA